MDQTTFGDRHIRIQGIRMYTVFSSPGSGGETPLVLVHGLSCSHRYMMPLARQLAPHRQIAIPDLPGFGDSEKIRLVPDIAELAAALLAWMDAMELARACFLANSLGCQVVAYLALWRPDRVERAIFIGPTVDPSARSVPRQAGRLALDMLREPLGLQLVLLHDFFAAGPRRVVLTAQAAVQDRIEDRLPRLRMPVLIVRGARDPLAPQAWAEEATRLLPQGQLVVVPGAAHDAHWSQPVELARDVILPFLAGAQPRLEAKG
jgi:pimeloyl-ACP methyl ester carboxylesterase